VPVQLARRQHGAERVAEAQRAGRGPPRAAAAVRRARPLGVGGRPHAAPPVQHHLAGAREVLQVLLLHRGAEALVFHDHVQLAVAEPARDVEVGRADARPAPVRHRGLGVDHGPVPLEHLDAALEQRAIARPRDGLHDPHVAAASGHQQAHVDAVLGGRAQRLHVGARARVIGIREPEPPSRERGHELVETEQPGGSRRRGDDADGHLAHGRELSRKVRLGQLRAAGRPRVGERSSHGGHGWAAQLHAGVAPGRHAARGVAFPHAAHAQPGYERHLAVHDQALPVVAAQPAEGVVEARRVVAAHVDAVRAETLPEPARGVSDGAHPVVHQANRNARSRLLRERFQEALAHRVLVEDVALEMDGAARTGDGVEPGRVVLSRVAEQANGVARNRLRSGGARERVLGGAHGDSIRAWHTRPAR
jgi:hypothetical protein